MQYTVTGKIIEVGEIIPCTGKTKEKCTFLIQDEDDGGREIAFLIFDDNISKFLEPLEIGDKVRVSFSIKTRRYIDKYNNTSYITSCFALNVEKIEEKKQRTSRDRYRSRAEENPFSENKSKFWEEFGNKQQTPPWESQTKSTYTNWFQGVSNSQEAKKVYRTLSKKWHSDVPGGSDEIMKEINIQYERWK